MTALNYEGHICARCGGGIPVEELLLTRRDAWHESCYIASVYFPLCIKRPPRRESK